MSTVDLRGSYGNDVYSPRSDDEAGRQTFLDSREDFDFACQFAMVGDLGRLVAKKVSGWPRAAGLSPGWGQ